MTVTNEASERIDALGAAISRVSSVLDGLLSSGILTTNFMDAHNCRGSKKYVPAYIFEFVRDAGTCPRFEDASRDHAAFVTLIRTSIERRIPGAGTEVLARLSSSLRRFAAESLEHRAEIRALHMMRMLRIGWDLLSEIAAESLWTPDPTLGSLVERTLAGAVPPPSYMSRSETVDLAVQVLLANGLEQEAAVAATFHNYNPMHYY